MGSSYEITRPSSPRECPAVMSSNRPPQRTVVAFIRRSLKAALARQEMLLKEITHRVKNSLAIVASMLKLQAGGTADPELTRHLQEAAYRVSAVAKAHERIHQGLDTDRLDFGIYIEQVCNDLNDAVSPYKYRGRG
jgi:two-component sensor histidine kinase